jgi:molecular chaperone GrpE
MSDLKVTDRRWWAKGAGAVPAESESSLKPTYVEELESRLASKDAELRELLGRFRAASEEFDHARARLRKEVGKDLERSRRSVIVSFLEVLDNLDRALLSVGAAADRADDPFVRGVSLVRQQFLAALEGLGVSRIEPKGAFDPVRHEAVTTVAAPEGTPAGEIVGVVRPGYLIGDEVLRPAQVAVAG